MNSAEITRVTAIFFSLLIALFGLSRWPGLYRIREEYRRKTLHLAAGILAIGLPLLFARAAPVLFLCGAVFAALVALRFSARRIYDADRFSYGELCIPVAVAFLFVVAGRDAVSYYVPLTVFTLADSVAALAGQRLPRKRIGVFTGDKTVAGSVSFFVVALLVTLGGLALFAGDVSGKSFAIASIVALDLAIVEALCRYGLDNLLIPVVGFFLLQHLNDAGEPEMVIHIAIAGGLAALLTLQTSPGSALSSLWKRGVR